MKAAFCSAVVVSSMLSGLASAQDLSQIKPTATLQEQVEQLPQPGVLRAPIRLLPKSGPLTPPAYCNPCLFYAGDSNPSNPQANGVWDENNSYFPDNGVVYTPFIASKIAKGKAWNLSGLFANIEYYPYPPAQPTDAVWSIVSGVVDGGLPSSATVVCSGTDPAPTLTDTGRLFFGFYEEYTTAVKVTGCRLPVSKKGYTLWETVTPEYGVFQLAFESDAEDGGPSGTPPEAFGTPQPWDDSFFVGIDFGFPNFTATHSVVCGNQGCDRFSAGVEGTMVK